MQTVGNNQTNVRFGIPMRSNQMPGCPLVRLLGQESTSWALDRSRPEYRSNPDKASPLTGPAHQSALSGRRIE